LELSAKNTAITVEEISENLQHRDLIDTTRDHSPLKQADDALLLDNSNISKSEQLEIALAWAQQRISQAK